MAPETDSKPPNSTKIPINEQIADIVLKVIMTGGVAGGGLGAFWSLFKDSDIPKAMAAAGIGLGISYAARMLMPVHRGTQRRLEQAGEKIDAGIDRALVKAGGVEGKYLQSQAWACQAARSEGVAQHEGIFTPLLEEVFVPLELDRSSNSPGFDALALNCAAPELDSVSSAYLDIWKLLAQADQITTFKHLAILAWGGYGKTTLLKHIAYIYGTKQQARNVRPKIPVLLILRKYRDLLAQPDPPGLIELITRHHIPNLPGSADLEVPADWVKGKLKAGKAVVMLDGFDEVSVAQRPAVAKWINTEVDPKD